MKNKKLVLVLAGLVALSSQAATFDWGSQEMRDYGGPMDDGGGWALNGVQTFLYYGGVNGAETFGGVAWDPIAGALTIASGTNSGTFVDSYVTAGDDYDVYGAFNVTMGEIEPIGLTWLGDTSDTWEDMNLREFTIVAISSASGDLGDGSATWNFHTGNAKGFSTATAGGSIAAMNTGPGFDVSAMGALPVVPEPATFGLMAVAGLGMFLARKKTRR